MIQLFTFLLYIVDHIRDSYSRDRERHRYSSSRDYRGTADSTSNQNRHHRVDSSIDRSRVRDNDFLDVVDLVREDASPSSADDWQTGEVS